MCRVMVSKREVSTKIFEEGLEVKTILYKVQVPVTRPSEDDVLNSESKAWASVAIPGARDARNVECCCGNIKGHKWSHPKKEAMRTANGKTIQTASPGQ